MSSTKPPCPATAGLIIVSIRSWTFVLSSALMRHLSDGYCTRDPAEGQLALGGLRSAEPRLGEPWRPLPACGRRWERLVLGAGGPAGQRPHAIERDCRVLPLGGRGGDRGRHLRMQHLHAGGPMRPSIVELVLHQRAQ